MLGFPTAWFIATRPKRSRSFWLFLVTVPFWCNLLVRTFAIMQLIRNEGVINSLLRGLGVIDQPIQMLYTDFAVGLGMAYVYLPLMVLPLYASIEKLDFRLIEAAYDLYATRPARADPGRPAAGPAGPGRGLDPGLHPRTRRLCRPAHAGRRQADDDQQPDRPAVRPGPQLAARRFARLVPDADRAGGAAALRAPGRPRDARTMAERAFSVRRMPGFTPMAILVFVFLYAPIVILATYSFNAGTSLAIWEGFSLRWYVAAWQDVEVQAATFRSLGIATVAGVVSIVLATMAAVATTRTAAIPRPDRSCLR